MKLKTILIELGFDSAQIKQMLSNGQIAINGEDIKTDIDLDVVDDFTMELGEFMYINYKANKLLFGDVEIAKIVGIWHLFRTNDFLKGFLLVDVGKHQQFVLMKKD